MSGLEVPIHIGIEEDVDAVGDEPSVAILVAGAGVARNKPALIAMSVDFIYRLLEDRPHSIRAFCSFLRSRPANVVAYLLPSAFQQENRLTQFL